MTDPDRLDRPLARAAHPDGQQPTAACLDAETLAAWAEGTLRPHERATAEAHAADCGRCLQLLAVMARTEPPPVVAARPSWFSLRWLVPLTTAALAITAWVIIRDPRLVPPPVLQEMVSAPAPPPSSAAAAPPSELAKELMPEARRERDQRRDVSERKAETAPSAPANSAAAKGPTDSLARQAAAKPQETPTPEPTPPSAAASFRAETRDNVAQPQAKAAVAQHVIASPDPAVQWRLGDRTIEQTKDGGQTWHLQLTASAELVAGASPAAGTCWVVGRSGLVLVSTDGQTWRAVTPPVGGADLVAVTATDARSAAVTTTDGRTYRTVDAGATWTLQEIKSVPF